MGTPQVPDSKPDDAPGEPLEDVPRVGGVTWLMLACFLIPPAMVTLIGNNWVDIPHQTLWVVLLGAPIPLVLLTLPRRYVLDGHQFVISGFVYRVRVAREDILSVESIGTLRALSHPGSVFCSDPSRALRIVRREKRPLVVSPGDPAMVAALTSTAGDAPKGSEP